MSKEKLDKVAPFESLNKLIEEQEAERKPREKKSSRGRGRKAIYTRIVRVWLRESTYDKLADMAINNNVGLSEVLRTVIRFGLVAIDLENQKVDNG